MIDLTEIAKLFRVAYEETDGFGASHILVADGNVEDEYLDFCLTDRGKTVLPSEQKLIASLRPLTIRERLIAYHLSHADGYRFATAGEALSFAERMADQDIADDAD